MQYLAMHREVPIEHTLSDNYFLTKQISDAYFDGYLINYADMFTGYGIDDIDIVELNQSSVVSLLGKYPEKDFTSGSQYDKTYWQAQYAKHQRNRGHQIDQLNDVFNQRHGHGLSVMSHNKWWFNLFWLGVWAMVVIQATFGLLNQQISALDWWVNLIQAVWSCGITYLIFTYVIYYLWKYWFINRHLTMNQSLVGDK